MRAIVAALVVLAALPLAVPTTNACHMPMEQDAWDPWNVPNEPHAGPADFHWHECGDGHAWVCVHTKEFDDCLQTW